MTSDVPEMTRFDGPAPRMVKCSRCGELTPRRDGATVKGPLCAVCRQLIIAGMAIAALEASEDR